MCDIYDGDRAELWKPVERKAAKQHSCCSCSGFIEKGHIYQHLTIISDGDVYTEKSCALCTAMWQDFFDAHNGGFGPSSFADSLEDCIDRPRRYRDDRAGFLKVRVDYMSSIREEDKKWRNYLAIIKLRRYRNDQQKAKQQANVSAASPGC